MLNEIFEEHRRKEADMLFRHPWFNMVVNYIIAILLIALIFAFVSWGISIHTERKAADFAAIALAEYQAEREAAETARLTELKAQQSSEEAVIDRESKAIAKMLYGIRRFIDKYHYSETDLQTYARCAFNRKDAGSPNTLEVIIAQKDQFAGYSDDNPVLDEYYKLAKRFVTEWHEETVKPCDSSYQWAELTENGIFLKAKFTASGYERRFHF